MVALVAAPFAACKLALPVRRAARRVVAVRAEAQVAEKVEKAEAPASPAAAVQQQPAASTSSSKGGEVLRASPQERGNWGNADKQAIDDKDFVSGGCRAGWQRRNHPRRRRKAASSWLQRAPAAPLPPVQSSASTAPSLRS